MSLWFLYPHPFQTFICVNCYQRHLKMNSATNQSTYASASRNLVEEDKSQVGLFLFIVTFFIYNFSPFPPDSLFFLWRGFKVICSLVWSFLRGDVFKKSPFACFLVYSPKHTFPSSHLNRFISTLLLLPSLFPSSSERSSAPRRTIVFPHQSSKISFFCPGSLSSYEKGAEGAQQQQKQFSSIASMKLFTEGRSCIW